MHYHLKLLNYAQDKETVTAFLKKNDTYLVWQDGKVIDAETTRDFFYGYIPENKRYFDKQIIGAFEGSSLICVFDILSNYPIDHTWVIGLMLLDEQKRKQGIGTHLYRKIETYLLAKSVQTSGKSSLDSSITL